MQTIKSHFFSLMDGFSKVPFGDRLSAILMILLPLLLVVGRGVADVAISLCAVIFLLSAFLKKDFSAMKQKWFLFAVIFWVYIVLISFSGIDPENSMGRALPWIRFILFALAVQYIFQTYPDLLKYLIVSVFLTLGFVMFDALNQYVTGTGIFGHIKQGVRLTAPFDNMVVGIFISALFPLIGAIAVKSFLTGNISENVKLKIMSLAFVLLALVTVFLSGERMALVLFGFSVLMILFCYFRDLKKAVILIAVLSIVLTALFFLFQDLFQRHIGQTLAQISSGKDSSYFMLFTSGIRVFLDHPFFGVGLKNYRFLSEDYMIGTEKAAAFAANIHPHNYYIEILAETGIIGLILFILIFSFWVRAILQSKPLSQNPFLVGGFIAVLVKLWPLSTTGSFFTNWNASIFWFLFGISLIMLPLARNNNRGERK